MCDGLWLMSDVFSEHPPSDIRHQTCSRPQPVAYPRKWRRPEKSLQHGTLFDNLGLGNGDRELGRRSRLRRRFFKGIHLSHCPLPTAHCPLPTALLRISMAQSFTLDRAGRHLCDWGMSLLSFRARIAGYFILFFFTGCGISVVWVSDRSDTPALFPDTPPPGSEHTLTEADYQMP